MTYRDKGIAFGRASGDGPYRLDFSGHSEVCLKIRINSLINILARNASINDVS